jgi:hypothetical protein
MTIPPVPVEPSPPATIGTNPRNADEVNGLIGTHLKGFLASRVTIEQDENFLVATELTAAPYYFTSDQETQLKTAIAGLNTSLQAVDLTFISRIVGMF